MTFNKYMHPRNKYKTPPDFKQLAIEYPEFRKHVSPDLSGKLKYNFKNEEALRIFTTTLLHKDYNLNVYIPPLRLVPTLPLRLNYILWIEDLLNLNQIKSPIFGIDIGTGASCIYPLLASKDRGWNMIALDNDEFNYETALKNVKDNKLEHLIKVKKCTEFCNLNNYLDSSIEYYNFTMCNPPFYNSNEEEINKSRTNRRSKPNNIKTGVQNELEIYGGEVEFVKSIIINNNDVQDRIRIFTTMLGHKSSLIILQQYLSNYPLIKSISTIEFCQGNTMRWGIAWTFHKDIQLKNYYRDKNQIKKEKIKPLCYIIKSNNYIENIIEKILNLCDKLKIIYKILQKEDNIYKINIIAYENTWSNQRKLKRQIQQKEQQIKLNFNKDINKLNNDEKINTDMEVDEIVKRNETENIRIRNSKRKRNNNKIEEKKKEINQNEKQENTILKLNNEPSKMIKSDIEVDNIINETDNVRNNKRKRNDDLKDNKTSKKFNVNIEKNNNDRNLNVIVKNDIKTNSNSELNNETNSNNAINKTSNPNSIENSNNESIDKTSNTNIIGNSNNELIYKTSNTNNNENSNNNCTNNKTALIICNLLIKKLNNDIILEIIYVSGNGNKELTNQILQYFKNHIKS